MHVRYQEPGDEYERRCQESQVLVEVTLRPNEIIQPVVENHEQNEDPLRKIEREDALRWFRLGDSRHPQRRQCATAQTSRVELRVHGTMPKMAPRFAPAPLYCQRNDDAAALAKEAGVFRWCSCGRL